MKRDRKTLKILHVVILAAGLAFIVHYNIAQGEKGLRTEPNLEEVKSAFSGELRSGVISSPIPHYRGTVKQGEGTEQALAVSSSALPPGIKGYADEISLLVVVDSKGYVRNIRLIDHNETPGYMQRVLESGFLDKLVGKKADDLTQVDAVTSATITSKSIRDDVSSSAALAANKVFGLHMKAPSPPTWLGSLTDPKVMAVLLALGLALYGRLGKWPSRYRKEAVWISSILLVGVFAMTPYTLVHTFQLLKLNLPGPANAITAVLAVFVIVTTLVWGPVWCGYACPFGALQELLGKLPIKKWKVTSGIIRYAREIRYLVLFVTVAGAFGLGVSAFAEVEPFGHLFGRSREPVAWVFIIVVLVGALFVRRFWCRFFCPTGACLVILSSHRKYVKQVRRGVEDAAIDSSDYPSEDRDTERNENE